MVVVVAVKRLDMQRDAGVHARRPGRIRAPARCRTSPILARREGDLPDTRKGRPETSTRDAGQRLVHRQMRRRRSGVMPVLSPSACLTAWPSAMPTSSTVWWWSIWRSPLAATVMSIRRWRASCSSMWSRKPTPVAISACRCRRDRRLTEISVSLVLREMLARAHGNALRDPLRPRRLSVGVRATPVSAEATTSRQTCVPRARCRRLPEAVSPVCRHAIRSSAVAGPCKPAGISPAARAGTACSWRTRRNHCEGA